MKKVLVGCNFVDHSLIFFQSRYLSIVYLTGLVVVDKPANLCIVYRLKNINMFHFVVYTNTHMERIHLVPGDNQVSISTNCCCNQDK